MKNILFLVHRIPYPPNKGDKIRSYNFLKGLAEKYRIHLGAFIDDADDWQYTGKVEQYVASSLFVSLVPSTAKIKSLSGLLTGKPLSLPYYQSNQMQRWVDTVIQENAIDTVFVFSSVMAQYIEKYTEAKVTVDFVDVDSDKWLQYSKKAKWPMSWIYQREAKSLLKFDQRVAINAKMSLFVSQEEANLFEYLSDVASKQISFVNNGVDTEYFNNSDAYIDPYKTDKKIIAFTGAMDYWANVDAVVWFARDVFPLIKQRNPDIEFYIVGSNPSKEVLLLAEQQAVFVTGRVDDIRPYLFCSDVLVAPLLIARGIQNKVLEGMAMGKKMVVTPQAIEGIRLDKQEVAVTENAAEFADQVLSVLQTAQLNSQVNCDYVLKNYSWRTSLERLVQIIEKG